MTSATSADWSTQLVATRCGWGASRRRKWMEAALGMA